MRTKYCQSLNTKINCSIVLKYEKIGQIWHSQIRKIDAFFGLKKYLLAFSLPKSKKTLALSLCRWFLTSILYFQEKLPILYIFHFYVLCEKIKLPHSILFFRWSNQIMKQIMKTNLRRKGLPKKFLVGLSVHLFICMSVRPYVHISLNL